MHTQFDNTAAEVWIIEDDPGIGMLYQDLLEGNRTMRLIESIEQFKGCLQDNETTKPALVVADLRLPDGNFLENFLLKDFALVHDIPIIIASADSDLTTLTGCLHSGAVDYLIKPFIANQLIAKIDWHIGKASSPKVKLPFYVDAVANKVLDRAGRTVELTKRETQMLCKMLDFYPNGICRNTILKSLWGEVSVTPKVVDVHLSHLRAKLLKFGVQILCADGHYKIEAASC